MLPVGCPNRHESPLIRPYPGQLREGSDEPGTAMLTAIPGSGEPRPPERKVAGSNPAGRAYESHLR
jgi:hypothetical protein